MVKIYQITVSLKEFLFSAILFVAGDTKYANNQCSCDAHKQPRDKRVPGLRYVKRLMRVEGV
jgi:hypothetical protein